MLSISVSDITFFVKSSNQCLIRVEGPQGKPVAFNFNLNQMHELEDAVCKTLARMYSQEKREEDAQFDERDIYNEQLEFDI